ncbi:putative TBP associated factor (Mot1) [Planoprotostelium fungivorum]|uniref:Putative TBP associated factor (Mot1) n=1 Tax=Planoprotostelium fungivorum TaxID=1890364 RepID=A0A2P6MSY7_9EUKA|nr:putative TBP associated factor (Mot1) [Planoprotostelium fungivorum]
MSRQADRVIQLIHSGTTAAVRQAAAKQLADIVRKHPNQLNDVLSKIFPSLMSDKWEVRVSAGQAMESIFPSTLPSNDGREEGFISFQEFDVDKVLQHGVPLLATKGSDYDEGLDHLSVEERIRIQRENIKKRMGLDWKYMRKEIVTDADLEKGIMTTEQKKMRKQEDEEKKVKSDKVLDAFINRDKLSVREKNILKRKLERDNAKKMEEESFNIQPKRLKTENKQEGDEEEKDTPIVDPNTWPFENFCQELFLRLFDPRWETRHGSAIALREIIRHHGDTAGTCPLYGIIYNETSNQRWMEDAVTRLLCVFILDRFSDFVLDKAVAPVRENCAQVLGAVLRHLSHDISVKVVRVLFILQHRTEWEVRQSGYLGLKYFVAVRPDVVQSHASEVMQAVTLGLSDEDDDVRAVTCEVITPIVKKLPVDVKLRISTLLWDSLKEPDDLSVSVSFVMNIIDVLLDDEELKEEIVKDGSSLVSILPFFRHKISSVRSSSLDVIHRLLRRSTTINITDDQLSDLIRMLYQNILFEEREDVTEKTVETWEVVMRCSETEQLGRILSNLIPTFYNLTVSHRIDGSLLLSKYKSMNQTSDQPREEGKKKKGKKTEKETKITSSTTGYRHKMMGAQLIGTSLSHLSNPQTTLQWLSKHILSHRAEAILLAAFSLYHFLEKTKEKREGVDQVIASLMKWMDDDYSGSIEFAEVVDISETLVRECSSLSDNCRRAGVKMTPEEASPAFQSLDHIASWAAEISQRVKKTSQKNEVEESKSRLLGTCGRLSSVSSIYRTRVMAAVSGALVAGGIFSEKITPMVQSLMASIREEKDENVLTHSARCMSRMVLSCAKKGRNIVSLMNMCQKEGEEEKEKNRGKRCMSILAIQGEDQLFELLPSLRLQLADALSDTKETSRALHTLEGLIPSLSEISLNFPLSSLDRIFETLQYPQLTAVACRCLSLLFQKKRLIVIGKIFDVLMPQMSDPSVDKRRGATAAISKMIEDVDVDTIPFALLYIGALMPRMVDHDETVRREATKSFGQLVKLMPLEANTPDPEGMPGNLSEERKIQRKFMEQLIGGNQIEEFVLPVKVEATLRPYQKEGVSWLNFLRRYHLHGALCDDMGLGKTLQSVCILASHIYEEKKKGREKLSIVVCPSSLVTHWCHEIERFCVEFPLRTMAYVGNPNKRKEYYDILITSYETVRSDIAILEGINFDYCILDEGHIIRNSQTKTTKSIKKLNSQHRILLSGTPIQNQVLELWSIFDFLMPGMLNSEREFEKTYGKPIKRSRDPKSSPQQQQEGLLALEALHRQVLPFIMRRMKDDVLSDLPPKIIQDYYCDITPLQRRLYEEFSEKNSKESDRRHVFQSLQYLRKLCVHPSLVLSSKHPMWGEVKRDTDDLGDIRHSAKLEALRQLLIECCGDEVEREEEDSDDEEREKEQMTDDLKHKVLIFAQTKSALDLIENCVLRECLPHLRYLRMDGDVDASMRQDMVDVFNRDSSIDLFLLTTHVGGLGLNLTGADVVIFVEHDWNPMKDMQAMDRAHRIGAKRTVNVYRIITRDTMEEKIMSLQRFKTAVAEAVVNAENASTDTMKTSDVLDLLALTKEGERKRTDSKANEWTMGDLEEAEYAEEYDVDKFIEKMK